MNLSGIRISAGFYDYNSIENRAVTVGSELPAELPQSVTDQAPSAEEHAAPAVSRKSDRIREPSITRTATSRMQSTS